MDDFYAETVHCHINRDHGESLVRYRRRVAAELAWMGLPPGALAGKTVLDVGSGYQALILAELGARRVCHFDISPRQVAWLQGQGAQRGDGVIVSQCRDIVQGMGALPPLDLVFLVGVYHHLQDPARVLQQVAPCLRPGGKIFIRCYRSGTWSRWLTARLRPLAAFLTPSLVEEVFATLFPHQPDQRFLGDMLDDLFVPVWGCFHPEQFFQDAATLGLTFCSDSPNFVWDHGDRDENFRVVMTRQSPQSSPVPPLEVFLANNSINQNTLAVDDSDILKEMAAAFGRLAAAAATMAPLSLACRLITLYQWVRRATPWDCYGQTRFMAGKPSEQLAKDRQQSLLGVLQRWQPCVAREHS